MHVNTLGLFTALIYKIEAINLRRIYLTDLPPRLLPVRGLRPPLGAGGRVRPESGRRAGERTKIFDGSFRLVAAMSR